jgi:hypothetical protein
VKIVKLSEKRYEKPEENQVNELQANIMKESIRNQYRYMMQLRSCSQLRNNLAICIIIIIYLQIPTVIFIYFAIY